MHARSPLIFIFITVMLDAIGIGLILPVMPELIRQLHGDTVSAAALWGGLMAFTYAAMQFLCGPLLGSLSDRFGRRPVLILSLVFMGLDYLLMAMAPTLWLLFVARFISGVTGATHATALAFLADVSAKGKRSANFGLVGAAFGIGFIFGPAIGGLLGTLGPSAPFIVAGVIALGNALFGYLVLPETLPPERRRTFEWSRANPFRALMRMRHLPMVGGLMAVNFVYMVSNYVYAAVWSYFTIERFGWSVGMVGLSLAAFGITSALAQGWLIRVFLRLLGERHTAILGLIMTITAMLLLVLMRDGIWVFVLMPIISLGVIVGPALQGMMADRVSDSEQGELQGVVSSLTAVAVILSPLLMNGVFRLFTREDAPVYLPGAPFLVAAILAAVALMMLARVPRQD